MINGRLPEGKFKWHLKMRAESLRDIVRQEKLEESELSVGASSLWQQMMELEYTSSESFTYEDVQGEIDEELLDNTPLREIFDELIENSYIIANDNNKAEEPDYHINGVKVDEFRLLEHMGSDGLIEDDSSDDEDGERLHVRESGE